ncbi:MAG: BON domain-containing protein [Gemmatimonadaceae bacterium]|nr:BON domain-containing protein [Gemmatimonadaceae bacterium]
MARIRYQDEESRSGTLASVVVGALAGFAVGVLVVQRMGGISGVKNRLRRRVGSDLEAGSYAGHGAEVGDYYDADDEIVDDDRDTDLEDRVLEAFRNDPTMSERGIDIGSAGPGVIELSGWVEVDAESDYAVTLAGGVPGVDTVLNRLGIGDEEEALADAARRRAEGDPALNESHWEGQRVGTGKRRQGNSAEVDRHADPAVGLEDHSLRTQEAIRLAADDTEGLAERRGRNQRSKQRGDRTSGSPVGPTGVPKGDHVANPLEADAE